MSFELDLVPEEHEDGRARLGSGLRTGWEYQMSPLNLENLVFCGSTTGLLHLAAVSLAKGRSLQPAGGEEPHICLTS